MRFEFHFDHSAYDSDPGACSIHLKFGIHFLLHTAICDVN